MVNSGYTLQTGKLVNYIVHEQYPEFFKTNGAKNGIPLSPGIFTIYNYRVQCVIRSDPD